MADRETYRHPCLLGRVDIHFERPMGSDLPGSAPARGAASRLEKCLDPGKIDLTRGETD